jgi:hypothetical protein
MTRLSRGEFWLLGAVVKFPIWLSPLVRSKPKDLVAFYNRQHHGLTPGQLLDALESLVFNGWIECNQSSAYEVENSFKPTESEMKSALFAKCEADQDDLAIRMTTSGGKVWEDFVRPDWNRFIDYSGGDDEVMIAAVRRDLVEMYLRASDNISYRMIPGSEIWSVQTPYKLLYWKEVPHAHQVIFRIETGTEGRNIMYGPKVWTSHEQSRVDQLREQRVLAFSNWYSWR